MKNIKTYIIVLACILVASCGSSSGGGSSSVTAPNTVSGKVYRMTISTGAGFYATTGTYTVSFSAIQNTYTSTGDGVNVADSAGTYTYSANGNIGVASIVDSVIGNGSFAFTFTSVTGGTFLATAASDPGSNQSGTFVQL